MKKLSRLLIRHLRADFDPVVYGGTVVMIAVLMVLNYQFGVFRMFNRNHFDLRVFPLYMLFYGVPWLGVLALQWARGRIKITEPGFLRMALAALLIVSMTDWFPYHTRVAGYFDPALKDWIGSLVWNMKSTICWFIPMYLYWRIFDRDRDHTLYGCTVKGFEARPYLFCLAVILPLACWASFQPSFLAAYPTYSPGPAEVYLGVSPWVTVILYEFVYGFDFTFVELFFRGFLVIGMARWLGRNAVLPMVAMYAVLHFGKPIPETLGSIIGGYILGVFALESRSIAGGILLHVGLAFTMEATAFAQHAFGNK